jgi:hypothetical protein
LPCTCSCRLPKSAGDDSGLEKPAASKKRGRQARKSSATAEESEEREEEQEGEADGNGQQEGPEEGVTQAEAGEQGPGLARSLVFMRPCCYVELGCGLPIAWDPWLSEPYVMEVFFFGKGV